MDEAYSGNQKRKKEKKKRKRQCPGKKKRKMKKRRRKRQHPDQTKKKRKEKKEKRIERNPCASPHGHSRHLPIKLFPLSFLFILEGKFLVGFERKHLDLTIIFLFAPPYQTLSKKFSPHFFFFFILPKIHITKYTLRVTLSWT